MMLPACAGVILCYTRYNHSGRHAPRMRGGDPLQAFHAPPPLKMLPACAGVILALLMKSV